MVGGGVWDKIKKNSTQYFTIGGGEPQTSEDGCLYIIPIAGVFTTIYFKLSVAPNSSNLAGQCTFNIRRNQVQIDTVTLTTSDSGSVSPTQSYAVEDKFSIEYNTNNNAPNNMTLTWSALFTPN